MGYLIGYPQSMWAGRTVTDYEVSCKLLRNCIKIQCLLWLPMIVSQFPSEHRTGPRSTE